MAITLGQQANKIPKRNLILWLDPNNINSYNPDVNKETWYDLTRFKSNWQVSPTAYKVQNGVKYFDFNGSFGCAKTSDLSNFVVTGKDQNHVTYIVWTRVLNSTANWRTLTRGNDGSYSNGLSSMLADHHVMINNGGWEMGKYDNNTGGGMLTTGLLQTQLPNYGTSQWMMLHVRWSSGSPYMRFSWNDTPGTIRGQSTDVRTSHRVGFASIGAHHNGSSNVLDSSQYWGDIGFFGVWNRELSDAEIMDVWNSTASTYGFTVSQQATSSAVSFQNSTVQNSATISQTRGELISINTYGVTSSGTFTWSKPAECTKVHVKVTGGGGGAAGYCESGGAGGYAEKWIDVTNVSSVSVTVGGGGASVGYYAGSNNGGTSSFGSYVSASGGYGANQNYSHSGGAGGVGSGGQINLYGGDGTGHANSHGYYPGGHGGGSFWGGATGVYRPGVNAKMANGAPGTGGPGSRTDDGGGGASTANGEHGIVVVYNYK